MTAITKKTLKSTIPNFARSRPATENSTLRNLQWGVQQKTNNNMDNKNFITYFESKTLTISTLKCTSHGGVYNGHQFGKNSTKSKQ